LAHCSICGATTDPRILAYADMLTDSVRHQLRRAAPDGQAVDSLCPQCVLDAMYAVVDARHDTSLHTTSEPHTTFPYYHPWEETVLGQTARLPDYATFDGNGVTIAFLDSGFYPHPDLLKAVPFDHVPAWETMTALDLRSWLRDRPTRLVHYVDLRQNGEQTGLDADSLWDNHWLSWHGQMTTVIAAGNGLLSQGRLRGYAPRAGVLPIAVGQGDGRIPEEDILAGFQWLLRDDNWARYNVRVVNVSVGGDFPDYWTDNAVCLAAEELSRQGVLICAAAGNSGTERLLAPAQTPSVLTVGGFDDANRPWSPHHPDEVAGLTLYHHNFGQVYAADGPIRKPELLAVGRYVGSPILPPSPVLHETHAIAALRDVLMGDDPAHLERLLSHWHRVMHVEDERQALGQLLTEHRARKDKDASLPEIWQALRKRMNAHKWIHPYYQHADGSSVAVAQVSAVAAQMFQANPRLTGEQVKALLLATALRVEHFPLAQQGRGILQPVAAGAAALRAPGGILAGFPASGAVVHERQLHKWNFRGTLTRQTAVGPQRDAAPSPGRSEYAYVGLYAPGASAVSLIGSFNNWTPALLPLERTPEGWWHTAVNLPPGLHPYRFWVVDRAHPDGHWVTDPENPRRIESGYREPHGLLVIDG
jgi:serine protease AprX